MLMSPHPLIVFAISPALVEADHLTLKSNSPIDDGILMPNRFHRAFARMARTTSDIKTLSPWKNCIGELSSIAAKPFSWSARMLARVLRFYSNAISQAKCGSWLIKSIAERLRAVVGLIDAAVVELLPCLSSHLSLSP
jgi:hypothetical protein